MCNKILNCGLDVKSYMSCPNCKSRLVVILFCFVLFCILCFSVLFFIFYFF